MLCVEWSDRVKGEMQERGETGRRKGPENGGVSAHMEGWSWTRAGTSHPV